MKSILLTCSFLLLLFAGRTQVNSGDPQLDLRLKQFIHLNKEKKYSEVIDFLHPRVLALTTREQMLDMMDFLFDSSQTVISIEKLKVLSVSAPYVLDDTAYRKIIIGMSMTLRIRDTSILQEPGLADQAIKSIAKLFSGKEVRLDRNTCTFSITGADTFIAIRDPGKSWLFLGYRKDPALDNLFSEKVLSHLGL